MQQPMAKFLFNPSVMTFSTTVPDMKPCTGVQKICGFSRGWHHWNSIRLGCNRSENSNFVRFFLYTYIKGKRNEQLIGTWQVGTKLNVELSFKHHVFSAVIHGVFGQYSKVEYAPIYFPFGYLLGNYAEIDNTNNKTPFHCQVEDLRVNGRVVKI
jgi:hypothetical protein